MIASKVIKTEPIQWRELKFVQGENFKTWNNGGNEKLLQSILKYQFIDPFKVWENDGILYCLDGRHRFLDLTAAEERGHAIPELLPATFIDCADETEAAEMVLIYSSTYAKITEQGLYDFVNKFNLDFPAMMELTNLPEFNAEAFMDVLKQNDKLDLDYSGKNQEVDFDELGDEMIIKLKYTEDQYHIVKGQLAQIASSPEAAVLKLLSNE